MPAGAECRIQSTSLEFGFTDADDYSDLIAYVEQSLTKNRYGVLIGCGRSVGIFVKQNGICSLRQPSNYWKQHWGNNNNVKFFQIFNNFLFLSM